MSNLKNFGMTIFLNKFFQSGGTVCQFFADRLLTKFKRIEKTLLCKMNKLN